MEYTSPFGPVLAGIFMVGLEARITATVTDRISHWKRYIDDKKKLLFCIYKEQLGRTCFSEFGPVLSKYPN